MSFTKSLGVAAGSAVIFELVYAGSQYANTVAAVTPMISNGEMVELGAGAVLTLAAWYGVKKGSAMLAALTLPAGVFLLIDGITNIIKKNLGTSLPAQMGSVPRIGVRQVGVRQVTPSPMVTPGFQAPLLTSSN